MGAAQRVRVEESAPEFPVIERCVVLVNRDASSTIPCTVFDYEIPVLKAIHGGSAIVVHSRKRVRAKIPAEQAYNQMLTKYPARDELDPKHVNHVYRDVHDFAQRTGMLIVNADAASDIQASAQIVHEEEEEIL